MKQITDIEVKILRCGNCNIEVNNVSDNCPLCGKYLVPEGEERETVYPSLEELAAKKTYNKWVKIVLFFIISISIITLVVNLLTPGHYLWSVVPIAAIWLLFPVIVLPLAKRKLTPMMIVLDNITISIFLIIVDSMVDAREWAMSYVVPFILFGSALIVTIIVVSKKMTWRELYLFQMSIAAICFIPIIASCFFNFVFWPSVASAVYGIITIIGMLIFGDKSLQFETKKRFHF